MKEEFEEERAQRSFDRNALANQLIADGDVSGAIEHLKDFGFLSDLNEAEMIIADNLISFIAKPLAQ